MKPTIYTNVYMGKGCTIEDNVVIGKTNNRTKLRARTYIGDNVTIRSGSIIYADTYIGSNTQIGHHAIIRENNTTEDLVSIGSYTELGPGNIIGRNTRIHSGCFLEDVTMGTNIFVGPHVVFTNDPHPHRPDLISCFCGAFVHDFAMIGGHATILPHITIGREALIGAGSVVTTDVAHREVVVGNPAKTIKKIDDIICMRNGILHYPYESYPAC